MRFRLPLAALVAAALGLALPAASQEAAPPAPPEGAEAPAFSEEELDAFVEVAVEVQALIAALRAETDRKIGALIEDHPGIDYETYHAIALRTRDDPSFKAKVDARVREGIETRIRESGGEAPGDATP